MRKLRILLDQYLFATDDVQAALRLLQALAGETVDGAVGLGRVSIDSDDAQGLPVEVNPADL